MIPLSRERRQGERRAHARGGRRATDRAGSSITAQSCPSCSSVANEVGEADGGWWFVCEGCDHLWNERERARKNRSADADAGSAENRSFLSWATATVVRQMQKGRSKS
jgi:hypothetical protein